MLFLRTFWYNIYKRRLKIYLYAHLLLRCWLGKLEVCRFTSLHMKVTWNESTSDTYAHSAYFITELLANALYSLKYLLSKW